MATKKIQILDSLNKNAVLYTPQELTEEDKAQARSNLSVPSLDENGKILSSQLPDDIGVDVDLSDYYTKTETDASLFGKADLVDGKIPVEQIPEGIVDLSGYYTKTEINEEINSVSETFNVELLKKADLIDGKIPTSQLPDDIGSGGGIAEVSWDDLADKPFGEIGEKIEWDGITSAEDIDVTNTLGVVIHKVSEVQTKEKLIGSSVNVLMGSGQAEEFVISESHFLDVSENAFVVMYNGLVVIIATKDAATENFYGVDVPFSSGGIWFCTSPAAYTTKSLASSDFGIKKIDKKYLPDDIGSGIGGATSWNDLTDKPFGETGWSIEWDGTPTDEYSDVSDTMGAILYRVGEAKTAEEVVGAVCKFDLIFDGVSQKNEHIIDASDVIDLDENAFVVFYDGLGLFVSALEAGVYNFMGINFDFPSAGTWFVKAPNYTPTYLGNTKLKQIDAKYIPNAFYETGIKIEWDGTPTSECIDGSALGAMAYKVGEPIAKENLIGSTVTVFTDSVFEGIITEDSLVDVGENGFLILVRELGVAMVTLAAGALDLSVFAPGLELEAPSEGIWFLTYSHGVYLKSLVSPDYEVKQIDKKFIPDDIVASVSLTFDEVPTEGSQNPVKSMGIHSAISALEGKITSTFCYKGTVANYSDLPTSDNTVGDVWNIANADETNGIYAGDNAAWNGLGWDILAGVIDLSDYYTKTEIDSIALNGTVNLANYYTKAEINNIIGNCNSVIGLINTLIGGANV